MGLRRSLELIVGWHAEPVRLGGLEIPMQRVRRGLVGFLAVLVPVNLFIGYLKWLDYTDDEQPLAFLQFFDLGSGSEHTLPAWVATLLLGAAGLSALVASRHRENDPVVRRGFVISAVALFYVSLDEAAYIHERANEPVRDLLGVGGGPLYWAWVVPALVVVAALAAILWPFLQRLPSATKHGLVLSAVVFVGCALGLEMLDATAFSVNDKEASVVTEVLTIVEECGEKLGAMLAVDTMLRYASTGLPTGSAVGEEVRNQR